MKVRAVVLMTLALGCSHAGAPSAAPGPAASAARAEAPSGGMCAEHGVPEALCTECNPKLIPVFQARGDWCAEHGFPESICPICKPEGSGAAATGETGTEAPADGTRVRLKSEGAAALAGIRTVPAVEGPVRDGVEAAARIVYDAALVAQVNPRAPGVIRAVLVDVGTRVPAGAPLAVIDSGEVGAGRSRLDASIARERATRARFDRLEALQREGGASVREVQEARQVLAEAQAGKAEAAAALGMVGGATTPSGSYRLTAPIAGVVLRRAATVGNFVVPENLLFEVVDPSRLWAEVDIPEGEVGRVAVGRRVSVAVPALGDREFSGTLGSLAPEVDPHTRTVRGRVALQNPDGTLRAHMFGTARIAPEASAPAILVPRDAAQRAKDVRLVFVRVADQIFEARRVEVLPGDHDLVAVRGRVRAGDPVVVDGSFLLKTETLKDSIGSGCCGAE